MMEPNFGIWIAAVVLFIIIAILQPCYYYSTVEIQWRSLFKIFVVSHAIVGISLLTVAIVMLRISHDYLTARICTIGYLVIGLCSLIGFLVVWVLERWQMIHTDDLTPLHVPDDIERTTVASSRKENSELGSLRLAPTNISGGTHTSTTALSPRSPWWVIENPPTGPVVASLDEITTGATSSARTPEGWF
ncbi:hypothetical protein B0I35DRAFT_446204 [Stachybotrys elegans]|uniref:Uncharacterized protein n=1 Tax=Stachybotrys elegans TaxID=80388 RepID=A0A8K0SE78_9HYPO|nr:hypothetical protein B0I35DRAFT_447405 [Stachybotrys elegans]KAH7303721.1 hypothetical protein B0I35DRAFT_446204 [Stachybotrys elegans]